MGFETSILIIDDDPHTLHHFTDIFLKAGFYKAMGAVTGDDVMEIIKNKKPSVVLLDVDISGENALETLSKIKIMNKLLPVIMLADESSKDLAVRALEKGASSYIVRSAPVANIVNDVRKELDKYLTATAARRKLTLMVIDDDTEVADMISQFLQADGHNCLVVNNPRKAIDIIMAHRPKMIFLDIVMPGMDGIDLLQEIKYVDKNIKVVMISGVADKEICLTAVKKGASGYITKPFSLQQLRATIVTTLFEQ
ncbi:response regulator [Candidatus Omnitrophota bacterium]